MGTASKPITPKEFQEYLKKEIERNLHDHQIREFWSYGWRGPDTVDPEYVGHAMWQIDGPAYGDPSAEAVPATIPEWQRAVVTQGSDLEGLMTLARWSIGLALFSSITEQWHSNDHNFELHWTSAILYLSMCSDRLRHIFIAVVFKMTEADYKKDEKTSDGKQRRRFVTPFDEACRSPSHSNVAVNDALSALRPYSHRIWEHIRSRNKIVHEIATAVARRQRARLQPPKLTKHDGKPTSYDQIEQLAKEADAAHKRSVAERISVLKDWYLLLVRSANEVFILEHYLRSAT